MTVHELQQRLGQPKPPIVIDIRDADEREISKLDNSLNIPEAEIHDRYQELDREADIAILCRSGIRSAYVVEYLRGLGFRNVQNVDGGINAWAEEIDPSMEIY
jgi:adenylyltransferase/sulfurtransferase